MWYTQQDPAFVQAPARVLCTYPCQHLSASPAGRVELVVHKGGVKAVCLHIALINHIQPVHIAQLIPVMTNKRKRVRVRKSESGHK